MPSREVSHETSRRRRRTNGMCGCGLEPVIPGQNYGRKCHAAAMRLWRAGQKAKRAAERAELETLRALRARTERRAESHQRGVE